MKNLVARLFATDLTGGLITPAAFAADENIQLWDNEGVYRRIGGWSLHHYTHQDTTSNHQRIPAANGAR